MTTTTPTLRTCPVCAQQVPVARFTVRDGLEVGHLPRHRPVVPAPFVACPGSFGPWVESPK